MLSLSLPPTLKNNLNVLKLHSPAPRQSQIVIYDPAGFRGDFREEILTQSLVVDDQSEVFRVQHSTQPAQSGVQVELLESVVSCGFNRVRTVYFSLEHRNKSFKYSEI